MEIKLSVFYRNKETNKFHIFHETVTELDIEEIAKEKTKDTPMWMDENWEYESFSAESVTI